MRQITRLRVLGIAAVLALSSAAWAGFGGQTILGPIGPGSVVAGDTTGATDDNDGIMSGDHIFFIWNGPDDVWQLNWPGGDLAVQMTYDNTSADLDLFLYTPDSYDDSGIFSIGNSGVENVELAGAVAGTYYLLIDSEDASTAGAYTMTVSAIAPPICHGDCDCSGAIGFGDIDYFVEAIPDNQAAWAALYADRHGGEQPPCAFANCDVNGDGHANFVDIDQFVTLIPSACP